jgi:hypothetical protein
VCARHKRPLSETNNTAEQGLGRPPQGVFEPLHGFRRPRQRAKFVAGQDTLNRKRWRGRIGGPLYRSAPSAVSDVVRQLLDIEFLIVHKAPHDVAD